MDPFNLNDQFENFLLQSKVAVHTCTPEQLKFIKFTFVAGWQSFGEVMAEHMPKLEHPAQTGIQLNKMLDDMEHYWKYEFKAPADFEAFPWRNINKN